MRSIPACAGEPQRRSGCRDGTRVYPRVCGGTLSGYFFCPYTVGLSPRVRGNHRHTRSRLSTRKVYPRVCGGTGHLRPRNTVRQGLSPRVRGNHLASPSFPFNERSIPACAGEPTTTATPMPIAKVYPRVCGGTLPTPREEIRVEGLSPRVRGNRRVRDANGGQFRSIPACAGEPPPR